MPCTKDNFQIPSHKQSKAKSMAMPNFAKVPPNHVLRQQKNKYLNTRSLSHSAEIGMYYQCQEREWKSLSSLARHCPCSWTQCLVSTIPTVPVSCPVSRNTHAWILGGTIRNQWGPKQTGQCSSFFRCQSNRQAALPNPLESSISVCNSPIHLREGLMLAKKNVCVQCWSFKRLLTQIISFMATISQKEIISVTLVERI